MKTFEVDIDNLDIVISYLRKLILNKNIIILLRGDLASGKTTLVKYYLKSLGFNENMVTSVTFSIQSIYNENIFHYDTYNIGIEKFVSLGLIEELDKDGIHFVEWGNKDLENLLHNYGYNYIIIDIIKKNNTRLYKIY